jgi:hypothetical protein
MTHPIDRVLAGANNTLGSSYWTDFDEAFMGFCSEMVILTLSGWERSKGIQREIKYFRSHNKFIRCLNRQANNEYSLVDCEITKINNGAQQK